MSPRIYAPTERECALSDHLQAMSLAAIAERGMPAAAEALGFDESALPRLIDEPQWDFKVAFRVADALALPIVDALMRSVNADLTAGQPSASASLRQVS